MSIDLYLSPTNHDLALSPQRDLMLVDGADRIRQQVEVTLLTFLGEWFLDETFGIPYLESIMVKSPNRAEIENIIRAKVKDVPGVDFVPSVLIEMESSTRRARITLPDIQTKEGLVTVEVTQ